MFASTSVGRGSFTLYYSLMTASGAVSTSFWGVVYDACGNYTPAMLTAPVLLAVGLAAMLLALRDRKG